MKTALAFLFFPAIMAVLIVVGLIFADGNPWGRDEVPMLEQLAAHDAAGGVDAWTDLQTALNSPDATGTPDAIALTGVRR